MEKATNEIAVKNQQALATIADENWGTEEASSTDIIIPMLSLMHGQSQLVQDGKANIGEIVRSTDSKILAKKGEKVEVIIFYQAPKTWRIYDVTDGDVKFVREELFQVGDREKYSDADGKPVGDFKEMMKDKNGKMVEKDLRRNFAHNFYGVIRSDVADGLKGFPIPLKMIFSRTSARVGKTISDHFAKCAAIGKPGAIISFKIGSDVVKGDKHTYQVFTVDYGTDTKPEEMMPCKEWWKIIKSNKGFKEDVVQESDVSAAAHVTTAPTTEEEREF